MTSHVGKTTVAIALMHAFRRRKGLRVQPFKVGPDFIDPSYHFRITGRQSRNLDVWMMGTEGVLESFVGACADSDIAVIEGVMGLFDGMSGKNSFASTAHISRILKAPILLVVDSSKSARSVAAMVLGFVNFEANVNIAGIILNNVAGDRHAAYIVDALEDKVKIPVVGIVKRDSAIKLEERHLGLIPTMELREQKQKTLLVAARTVGSQINIDKVLQLSGSNPLPDPQKAHTPFKEKVRIAVALDESFNFYYADNLDSLRRHGAKLLFFSPANDRKLPEGTDAVVLGGGFPEVLADKLQRNASMIKSLRHAAENGMLIYAECGGLMYLTRSIRGYKGETKARRMVGVIDADTAMTGRLTLNYTEADSNGSIFHHKRLRGHEFHYSTIENVSDDSRFAYTMKRGVGVKDSKDGFIVGNDGVASYMHLHFADCDLPERIVQACIMSSRR